MNYLFIIIFVLYLLFTIFFLKKLNLRKKIIYSVIYILILFAQFPYNYISAKNLNNINNLEAKTNKKPPVFIIVIDELSRKFILNKNGKIKKKYKNLSNFEKHNLNFINAKTNYAYTTQVFYSLIKGKIYPDNMKKNFMNYLKLEQDKNNIFLDFLNKDYKINIFSHLFFCENKKFNCYKPMHDYTKLLKIHVKFLSILIPDNIEANLFPYFSQKKEDYNFFKEFNNFRFAENNFYFFHTLMAHTPWLLDDNEIYLKTNDYKFKDNNKFEALANYDFAVQNVDRYLGIFFNNLKKQKLFDKSIIIIMSDHGICADTYCKNRTEKLNAYNTDLSNIILIVKNSKLNGEITDQFDLINIRTFMNDLILNNTYYKNKTYKNYKFYNNKNKIIYENK